MPIKKLLEDHFVVSVKKIGFISGLGLIQGQFGNHFGVRIISNGGLYIHSFGMNWIRISDPSEDHLDHCVSKGLVNPL